MCTKDFGISLDQVQKNIDATNKRMGGLTPNMTRVLWVNGEIDPWASQAVLQTDMPDQDTLWVNGASHHAWTHETLPTDCESINDARKKIFEQILDWLEE